MPTTTPLGLRYPASTGVSPDVPRDMGFLAGDVQTALGSVASGLQEGVLDAGGFEVTQASGGASMTLDVASNVGTGAFVDVDGLSPARVGRYYVPPTAAKTTVTIGTAHGSNPRVDRVVVSTAGVVSVVAGTATSGATLDNLTGAASVPADSLLLADVHVPAADTTIANTQIRDRRKWARGAYRRLAVTSAGGGVYTTTSANYALISSATLAPRIECSGAPLRLTLQGVWSVDTTSPAVAFGFTLDSAGVNGVSAVGSSWVLNYLFSQIGADTNAWPIHLQYDVIPSAGSHTIGPVWAVSAGVTLRIRAQPQIPLLFTVEELVRPDAANNATTSG